METEILDFNEINKIKQIVKNNGVIAFPTETVYGLGVRYDSFLAYEKIFEAKKRPKNKTLTLMLTDINDVDKYALVDEKTKKVIEHFMPGEITLVLPKRVDVDLYGSENNIGIRIPDSEETLRLLRGVGLPMFVTSANLSGEKATVSFAEVMEQLDGRIEAIVKGDAQNKKASTVASVTENKVTILREGPISLNEIEEVFIR